MVMKKRPDTGDFVSVIYIVDSVIFIEYVGWEFVLPLETLAWSTNKRSRWSLWYGSESPWCGFGFLDVDPDPCDADPDPCDVNPDPCDVDPDPCDVDPYSCDVDPDPCDVDPDPCDVDPDPCDVDRDPNDAYPDPWDVDPDPCDKDPDPCDKDPDLWDKDPDTCDDNIYFSNSFSNFLNPALIPHKCTPERLKSFMGFKGCVHF